MRQFLVQFLKESAICLPNDDRKLNHTMRSSEKQAMNIPKGLPKLV